MKSHLILIALLGAAQPALAQTAIDAAPARAQAAPADPAQLDRYVGYYQLSRYSLLHIFRSGNALHLAFTNAERDDVKLVAVSATVFDAPKYTRPVFARAEVRQLASRLTFSLDGGGNATGLVLRVLGKDWPAPKIEQAKAYSIEHALQQHASLHIESPGTRAFLQQFLQSIAAGAPDYSGMTPSLAANERRDPVIAGIGSLGPVKRIYQVVVTDDGSDRYTADFPRGVLDFIVSPPDPDGKIPGLLVRPTLRAGHGSVQARADQLGRVFDDPFIAKPPIPLDLK